jgi:hypothetical protein
MARMAERWYSRHSRTLQHTFAKKPIILYADHPAFQQTNTSGGFIDQSTGGFTDPTRNRVVMPLTGVYADNDHVLGHELVHVFQFDIESTQANAAGGPPGGGGGGGGLNRLPLWLIEGMAEYLSVGRDDPLTAMWLRDAALRNDIPTIRQLSTDPRYFPYRYGQALWAYIGGRWGDDMISQVYRGAIRQGWEPTIRRLLGVSSDSLSAQWLRDIRSTYLPLMQGRAAPNDVGSRILRRENPKQGEMDLSPALSPDGRYVAFLTSRGLFSIDLYVAETETGKIVKQLTGPNSDQHFEALSFINSAGSWSPDGRKLAFVVQNQGHHEIGIFDVASRKVEREIRVKGVDALSDPSWGANDRITFSGYAGGISDIYVYNIASGQVRQMTSDRNADLQPTWSPDGRTIAFVTDRGPGTDFTALTSAPMRLALMDAESGQIRVLQVFEGAKHINPQFSPDGRDLYFVSDQDGFSDIYRLALATNELYRVTRTATGVSGVTAISPAISVSRLDGRLAFTAFDHGGQTLRRLEAAQLVGVRVQTGPVQRSVAGLLPPVNPGQRDVVSEYLNDPATGLPSGPFPVTPYKAKLALEYLGTTGVGVQVGGAFGTGLSGGVSGYFTDLLTNKVVGATLLAQGQLKDIGGQLFYLDQSRRWNWSIGGAHIPYLQGGTLVSYDTTTSGALLQNVDQVIQRTYIDQVQATTAYPFSQIRRVELNASVIHQSYSAETDRFILDQFGNLIDQQRIPFPSPPGLTYAQTSLAFVGDYSSFGFTSPVAGGRYRFEGGPVFGDVKFVSALADYRRYIFLRPITLAFRGLHYGRYGTDSATNRLLQPLYIGQPQLVRGYDINDIRPEECVASATSSSGCPVFDRLVGSRIGVVSAEIRVPLFGTQALGLFNVPFLPTEISPFVDAGVAWSQNNNPRFVFERRSADRIPVVSVGVSARINLLGYAVGEVFYAYPFQRPDRGAHFGFQLAPGW